MARKQLLNQFRTVSYMRRSSAEQAERDLARQKRSLGQLVRRAWSWCRRRRS
ncbi:MAG: hypothetical protein JNK76_26820 [Planctomycetales bacterium]|nr:hypothetical protein [Planctomycetales bacterium]